MNEDPNKPSPPSSETETEFELPIAGFQGTPDEIERQWFEQVYRGRGDSMAQLTWRAVLMGTVLGAVLSLTNIYIGLKAGWSFGVAITACILSYSIWNGLRALGVVKTRMTILENNCMQSTASSAGYSTGGTLVSAFAAYIILNGHPLPFGLTLVWVFFLAVLGVTMAIPMKRQMINVEQLRFPSGVAAAETLRALYSQGEKGLRAARALGIAGVLAAVDKFWSDGLALLDGALAKIFHLTTNLAAFSSSTLVEKAQISLLGEDGYKLWNGRTVNFAWDSVYIGGGAIIGIRVCLSMVVSATLCWAVFVPVLQSHGYIAMKGGFRDDVQWTLWAGVACMVASGLLGFALEWRSALRAFASLGKMFGRGDAAKTDAMSAIEAPTSWFVAGQLVSMVALAWLAKYSFDMPIWQSALAVVLAFGLSLVACRVTGETDTTPVGPMGKVTQLTFGILNPGNVSVNLMSANITASSAGSAADLLVDLKSGYLLGAHPRKQFLAQFAGIFIGTAVTVCAFAALVPDASKLGTEQFPAPAAQTWAAVARAMREGLHALGPVKVWSIVVGAAVGIVFSVLPLAFPKQRKYLPSAAGVGLAWVFPWNNSFYFFIGGLLAWLFEKKSAQAAKELTFPIASGIIAGGSLMGVFLIFWENGPEIVQKLLGH